MEKFDNVSVVKKANIYFEGGVTSRSLYFPGGEMKTLGIIQPGEYEFNTEKKEIMEMLDGDVEVLLAGESQWRKYRPGDIFEIPANSSFRIKSNGLADYCCSFVD